MAATRTPSLHLYCGKGGVGKTTLAVAAARREAGRGRRVLVISTDPAHSLGDALRLRLTSVPRRVPSGRGTLTAAELDPGRAVERWLGGRRAALERILLRGTLLDRQDVARLLRLSLPGIDELVALVEIERLAPAGSPLDLVVVDTAPTGHTWRLLDAPGTIAGVAGVLDAMLARERDVAAAVGGRAPRDAGDALIEELSADAARLAARLRDPGMTRIVWITLAEPVAVAEAVDGVVWLRDRGLPLAGVVVNRSSPARSRSCRICRARAALERAALAPLRTAARGVTLTFVRETDRPAMRSSRLSDRAMARLPRAEISPTFTGLKVALVVGKGGVGKTTVAAGLAIAAARRRRTDRILLLSTDPAHSIGDVLSVRLGDSLARVPGAGALEAREVDAAAALARERADLRRAVERMFDSHAGAGESRRGLHVDLAHDRDVALRLLDLSPPGVDEIIALVSMVDAIERYDLVILDTAPTGHALKLLAMPGIAVQWLAELMRILLKYQELVPVGTLAEPILRLSRGVRRLQAVLTDPSLTRAVAVTRAAELPRLETVRLVQALEDLGIARAGVVVNAVTPPTSRCARCRAARAAEADEIRRLVRGGIRDIIIAPLELPPPRGAARLARWMSRWTPTIRG